MFDLSMFDDAAKSAREMTEKSASEKSTQSLSDFAAELFKTDAQLVIKSGLQFSTEKITVTANSKKSPQNRPGRLKPTEGKHGDNFATESNKARFYFRCALIALAAQNKGKISTVDVAALFVGCNLQTYETLLKSFKGVAADISKMLNRTVTVSPEYLEIEGLQECKELKQFCAPGNKIIALAKTSVKGTK